MNDSLIRVLLRWGDSNAYWFPFVRQRPIRTTPLSPAFVLLHAVSGLLWAGLPFLILVGLWMKRPSLEAFLIPGSIGAISAGTLALLIRAAWNRHAAGLPSPLAQGNAQDATLPAFLPAPPTVFERAFVAPALGLAILALAVTLVYGIENLRGSLALRAFNAELRAANAPVTLADIVPPPIPDDRNLAFAPLLRPMTDYNSAERARGEPVIWRDPEGFRRASHMLRVEDGTKSMAQFLSDRSKARRAEAATASPGTPAPAEPNPSDRRTSWLGGHPIDLALWQSYLLSLTNSPIVAPSESAARGVLLALSRHDTDLQELRAAAAARPECRFPLAYEEGFAMLLAPLATLKQSAVLLRLRACALLAENRTDEALADTLLALRLSDSVADQPILISVLVRIAIDQLAFQPIWEGCRDHRWTEAQLATLEAALATRNHPAALQRALDGERILSNIFYDGLARRDYRGLSYFDPNSESLGEDPFATLVRLMPRGWVRHNQIAHGRYVRALVDDLAKAPHHAALAPGGTHLDRIIDRKSLFNVIAGMLAPALDRASVKIYEAEAALGLARVGLALERRRLAANAYPASLDALAPRFIPVVPKDPMDGDPLRYALTPEGDFRLYSVGSDHVDDHGLRPDPNRKARSASEPRHNVDIVWR